MSFLGVAVLLESKHSFHHANDRPIATLQMQPNPLVNLVAGHRAGDRPPPVGTPSDRRPHSRQIFQTVRTAALLQQRRTSRPGLFRANVARGRVLECQPESGEFYQRGSNRSGVECLYHDRHLSPQRQLNSIDAGSGKDGAD